MADKFNKNTSSDDVNEFFSEFDKADEEKAGAQEPSSNTAEGTTPPLATGDSPSTATPTRATRGKKKSKNRKRDTKKSADKDNKKNTDKNSKTRNTSKKKEKKKKKKKKSKVRRFFAILALLILAMIIAGCVYVGIVVANTAHTAQSIDYKNIYSYLNQRSTLYDDKGKVMENVFTEGGNRANVKYEDLPENLKNGIVAIEDKTFWDHSGFNFIRMAGAVKSSLLGGGQISGTSTITQQLARNVYLANIKGQRTLSRKISEAYFTVVIEENLTKEQILEAYLNTIYLGFDCYGVEAASKAYFNKNVKDLNLLECASLCAIPKAPHGNALVKSHTLGTVSVDKSDVLAKSDSMMYVYNGDTSKDRRDLTIKNMVEYGYISQAEADEALNGSLKKEMKVTAGKSTGISSYFTDFAIDQIAKDIMDELGYSYNAARNLIYTGGLQIHTTMNKRMQKIVENTFANNSTFPSVVNLRKDDKNNILSKKTGKIILYDYYDYIGSNGKFTLKSNEFKENSDGSITIYKNKRLNLFDTQVNGARDISVQFKPMYLYRDGRLHTIENGVLSIPQQYKTYDAKKNCVVSAEFLKDKKSNIFKKRGSSLVISKSNYILQQEVVQPQAAMVIMDYKTGGVKAMVGGRNIKGKMLYNRAKEPRQPGSSIKPLAVYSAGMQAGVNALESGEGQNLSSTDGTNWGRYITAGSVINDKAIISPSGRSWPKNWYAGFRGRMTLRTSVEQSVNVCAVKTYQQMGPEFPTSQLKKMGISTVVEDGATNDMNPAALALGGMTKGISPLEMAGAYGIFPSGGTYTEPNAYTKILNSDGEPLLEKSKISKPETVLDPGVAFIMTDILRTTVTNGLGKHAAIGSQPVAGKTGTTSDNFDAWFCGFTPQHTAALWIGNDVNVELSVGSEAAADQWSAIMGQICAGTTYGHFQSQPNNVDRIGGEYYVKGTYSNIPRPSGTGDKTSVTTTEREEKPTTKPPTAPTTTAPPTTTTEPSSSSSEKTKKSSPKTPKKDSTGKSKKNR